MRILIRTSKWAIWARRFGSLAVPLVVVPILLHRERLIASSDFAVVEAAAIGVAVLAVILAIGAFVRLWITGDLGWSKAIWGLFFGLVCLAPAGFLVWLALHYPAVNEVSTDFAHPLPLISDVRPVPSSAPLQAAIKAAFPNARSRSYPIDATQMFTLVTQLTDQRGWEVRTLRAPPTALDEGQVNAIATTLLGWRDEVSIRIAGDAQGSAVAMRSVPLHGLHDFGENGRRIEEFLLALDQKVTLLLRDAPVAPAAPDAEPDAG